MKIRLLIPGLLVSVPAFAWQPQTGDIIFQISRYDERDDEHAEPAAERRGVVERRCDGTAATMPERTLTWLTVRKTRMP